MDVALVTGANGFIGTALVSELERRGTRVLSVTRRASVGSAQKDSRIVVGEIDGGTQWPEQELSGVDVVYHLAGRAHKLNERGEDFADRYYATNVAGTLRLAEQALDAGVNRFVFVSTIGVNGRATDDRPFSELDEPHPDGPYASTKLAAEMQLKALFHGQSAELVIIRPPLVYGPGNPGNFMRLIGLADTSFPLPFGSISNQRSLIYIDNIVDALILAGGHGNAVGKTFLVSDQDDQSIREILCRLRESLERPPRLFHCPPRLLHWIGVLIRREKEMEGLIGSLRVDSSLISRELGWTPPKTFAQGIAETVNWYRKR